MSDNYTAWDGNSYPWPPPDGWDLKSDGRYWPADQSPPAAAPSAPPTPAPQPVASSFGSGPPPGMAPPGGTPPPAMMPQPGVSPGAPIPVNKGSNNGLIALIIILGVIALTIGGCVVAIAQFANSAGDVIEEIEEAADEFEANQEAARREVTLDETGCQVVEGSPRAEGVIKNESGGRSDYTITVTFTDQNNLRLGNATTVVESVDDGEEVRFEVTSFETGIEGDIRCGLGDVSRYAS